MNDQLRALFPVTKNHVYLNHAAVAPISVPVFDAMMRYQQDLLEHGLVHFREWGQEVRQVRKLAARLINAWADEIAFAPNTSAGLAYVANGIDWRPGDNMVTAECEFPANLQPWFRLRREQGVELRLAKEHDGRLETEEILRLVDERTRIVSLSFVEYASGFRNDLRTIGRFCRERDVLFLVDGIQGLGALQLDVVDCCIDALSADAHKFLLGPDGVALLYVSRRAMERVKPTVVGWMSVANPFDFSELEQPLAPSACRFEPGALNTAGVVGLGAALELFLKTGLAEIESYVLGLSDYLSEQLQARGYRVVSARRAGETSAIVCCQHERHSAEQLYELLNERQIVTTPRLGRLRISPHFYNTRAELDQLLAALPD